MALAFGLAQRLGTEGRNVVVLLQGGVSRKVTVSDRG